MNWIVVPVRNNLHLTKKAVATFRKQDIGDVKILVIDNQSTDGTSQWLGSQKDLFTIYNNPPASVAKSWNIGLRLVMDHHREGHCLIVNNDVELRPDTYRWLVEDGGGFVTAVGTRDPAKIEPMGVAFELPRGGTFRKGQTVLLTEQPLAEVYDEPDPGKKRPHPDFSCYLIRKEVWEKVGPFDEGFKIAFGEDWDYHVRLHKAGVTACCLDLPFLHLGSMTIKNAEPDEVDRIQQQAEKNREYFKAKWGVVGASKEYYDLFGSEPPKGWY